MRKLLSFWLFTLLLFFLSCRSFVGSVELINILRHLEQEVLEFRKYVEAKWKERCLETTLTGCFNKNHDTCLVEYPNQVCAESQGPGTLLDTPECQGEEAELSGTCNGLFSFDHAAVRLKEGVGLDEFQRVKPKAMESLCFSLLLEEKMKEHYRNVSGYLYDTLGEDAVPYVYLGLSDSSFRLFPARQLPSNACNTYDPRVRPWYIAARSAPKDVLLILDHSGSILTQDLLEIVRATANTVLDSLQDVDRVGVVQMNNGPTLLLPTDAEFSGREILELATEKNIKALKRAIRRLSASGQANVVEAFDLAFDVLANTFELELEAQCHSSILFVTEGGIRELDSVVGLINARKSQTARVPMLFTYNIQASADAVTDTETLACRTNSLWSRVVSADRLDESLASFYKYFAFGLETQAKNQVTWVKPYPFSTSDNYGTTVSSPIYDRSVDPPVFVGAVGMDISIAAMEKALPGNNNRRFILDTVATLIRTNVNCASSVLNNDCHLESLRRIADLNKAVCPEACTNETLLVEFEPPRCAYHGKNTFYDFKHLLVNTLNEGKSFEERVCCTPSETGSSDDVCIAAATAANNKKDETPSLTPSLVPTTSPPTTLQSSEDENENENETNPDTTPPTNAPTAVTRSPSSAPAGNAVQNEEPASDSSGFLGISRGFLIGIIVVGVLLVVLFMGASGTIGFLCAKVQGQPKTPREVTTTPPDEDNNNYTTFLSPSVTHNDNETEDPVPVTNSYKPRLEGSESNGGDPQSGGGEGTNNFSAPSEPSREFSADKPEPAPAPAAVAAS